MPINLIHSWLHRVETGWDPIPRDYAEQYAEKAWNLYNSEELVENLAGLAHGLEGKRVLDLGGGPGQYSVLFAKRGARVMWHDISRQYEKIARARFTAAGVEVECSLGYLESAKKFGPESFDVVFSRVSWMYCRSDRHFAQLLYSLVKSGGLGYVECDTPARSKAAGLRKLQHALNKYFWWKLGHPVPPAGRIARLIQAYSLRALQLDYSSPLQDKVIFIKA
jgi:2-polyprenyl-3-methyl-5-hydroxy-6-metoxy-1,4-benzoquinol methylase